MPSTVPGPAVLLPLCLPRSTGLSLAPAGASSLSAASEAGSRYSASPASPIAPTSRRSPPLWQAAVFELDRIPAIRTLKDLDFQLEAANSFYENVAYHLMDSAVAARDPSVLSAFVRALEDRPSLESLFEFAAKTGLDSAYALYGHDPHPESPWSVLGDFIKTVAVKRSRRDERHGLRSLEYEFGEARIREVFLDALSDPHLCDKVERALMASIRSPLPFLRLNRLFHLLMDRDSEYKIGELIDWNGGLPTAFLDYPNLAMDPRELHDHYQRKLEGHLERKEIDVRVTDESGLTIVLRRKSGRPDLKRGLIEATFELPGPLVRKPTIYLLDLRNPIRMSANRLHEFVHIDQIALNGLAWCRSHYRLSELEAYDVDNTHLILNGDYDFHSAMTSLSPYGARMGRRNFVEKVDLRP